MTTLLNGVLGGLVIGLLAGGVCRFDDSAPPVTALLLERLTGHARPVSRSLELVVFVLYVGLAGKTLLALELFVLSVLGVPPSLGEALGVAVAWSAVLLVLWLIALRVVLSRPSKLSLRALVVFHLVYGVGLGLWFRATWIT